MESVPVAPLGSLPLRPVKSLSTSNRRDRERPANDCLASRDVIPIPQTRERVPRSHNRSPKEEGTRPLERSFAVSPRLRTFGEEKPALLSRFHLNKKRLVP